MSNESAQSIAEFIDIKLSQVKAILRAVNSDISEATDGKQKAQDIELLLMTAFEYLETLESKSTLLVDALVIAPAEAKQMIDDRIKQQIMTWGKK